MRCLALIIEHTRVGQSYRGEHSPSEKRLKVHRKERTELTVLGRCLVSLTEGVDCPHKYLPCNVASCFPI